MKKYIQPSSEVMMLQMESVIATSIPVKDNGTDAAPLSNRASIWDSNNWSGEEE